MVKRSKRGPRKRRKPLRDGMVEDCVTEEERAHEERAFEVISRSSQSWMRENKEDIRKASGEECAQKSYMGGMLDMLMVARHALGLWGADQLVSHLDRMGGHSCAEGPREGPGEIRVRIASDGKSKEEIVEEAKELGIQIARWIQEKNARGRRQARDPMFV